MTIYTRYGNEVIIRQAVRTLTGGVDHVGIAYVGGEKDGMLAYTEGSDEWVWYPLDMLLADGGIDEIDAACVAVEFAAKVAAVDAQYEVESRLGVIDDARLCINDMVTDAMICIPSETFHRDELRVKVYELFKYPLSSKQTRDCLYRLRVSGWGVSHLGLVSTQLGSNPMLLQIRDMFYQKQLHGLKATTAREILMQEDIASLISKGTSKADSAVIVSEFLARMNDEQVQDFLVRKYHYEWCVDRWVKSEKVRPFDFAGRRVQYGEKS